MIGLINRARIYQASTSELYGLVSETPAKETTPFHPRSHMRIQTIWILDSCKTIGKLLDMYAL